MAVRRTSYKAGDEVDSMCTKCKMLLAHTIIAMAGDKIAKVKCNTCAGVHAYRPPLSPSEATAKRRRAERAASAAEAAKVKTTPSEFELYTKGKDLSRAAKYTPKMTLGVGDAIDHPTFGIGIVTEIREGSKAQVAFKDGGRILIYGRP
jgi:hypothetical protein